MKRHYYISSDLDELDQVHEELNRAGLAMPQIHVLSRDDAGVAMRPHLHPVEDFLKKDVVRGTEFGAVGGVIGAVLVLAVAWFAKFPESVGWIPFVFLAIVVFGFCIWVGGLFGIQEPNSDFTRFKDDLEAGRHVFFVDIDEEQEATLSDIVAAHPSLESAGEGAATPKVVVEAQKKFKDAMETLP